MFVFIILNLFLGIFLKINSSFNFLLITDYSQFAGIFLVAVNVVATGFKFKKIPFALRYDLFAVGSIFIWISYWPPFFRAGSPVFYVLPLYFAFITAFLSLLFRVKRERLSIDAINDLQMLADFRLSNPLFVIAGVLVSLAFPEHFMLFPIAVTLLIIRFSLAYCLNNE